MELPGSASDADVLEYLRLWNLTGPVFVDFQDLSAGYEPDFCHVSSKHIVQQSGGWRVHGWALWRFRQGSETVIVGDFHSVWEQADGKLVDVTPPKRGTRVLFVRDPSLSIRATGSGQLLYHNRTNVPQAPRIWQGNPISDDTFEVPNNNPSLVAYCKKLGLPDTSMV